MAARLALALMRRPILPALQHRGQESTFDATRRRLQRRASAVSLLPKTSAGSTFKHLQCSLIASSDITVKVGRQDRDFIRRCLRQYRPPLVAFDSMLLSGIMLPERLRLRIKVCCWHPARLELILPQSGRVAESIAALRDNEGNCYLRIVGARCKTTVTSTAKRWKSAFYLVTSVSYLKLCNNHTISLNGLARSVPGEVTSPCARGAVCRLPRQK